MKLISRRASLSLTDVTPLFHELQVERLHGGAGVVCRYNNGYGASIVCHDGSYGGSEGLWELAVIHWDGEENEIVYDTPITDDVLGYLNEDEVLDILREIQKLPRKRG